MEQRIFQISTLSSTISASHVCISTSLAELLQFGFVLSICVKQVQMKMVNISTYLPNVYTELKHVSFPLLSFHVISWTCIPKIFSPVSCLSGSYHKQNVVDVVKLVSILEDYHYSSFA